MSLLSRAAIGQVPEDIWEFPIGGPADVCGARRGEGQTDHNHKLRPNIWPAFAGRDIEAQAHVQGGPDTDGAGSPRRMRGRSWPAERAGNGDSK